MGERDNRPPEPTRARRTGRAGFGMNIGLTVAVSAGVLVPSALAAQEAQKGMQSPVKTDTTTTLRLDASAVTAPVTGGIDLGRNRVVLAAAPVAAVEATPVKAAPQEPNPGYDRHTIGDGGTVSDIIVTSLHRQLGEDAKLPTGFVLDLTAFDAQASHIIDADHVNPDKPGTFGFVDTNGPLAKVLLDAEKGKPGNIDVVKEVAALHTAVGKGGYDATAARTAAQAVIDKVGATVPKLDKKAAPVTAHGHQEQGGTVAQVLDGVDKDVLQPALDTKDLQQEVKTAKDNGWVDTVELSRPTISHQLYEKGDTLAYTNLQDRVAVQATTFDTDINAKGTFDEHRMDKGDKFNKPGKELQALFKGVSDLTVMDMLAIKKDHPDLFPYVLQLWIINHRSTPHTSDDAQEVRLQDEEAMAALRVVVTYDRTKLAPAQVKFVQAINEAKTAEDRRRVVMAEVAGLLPSFFPKAPAATRPTGQSTATATAPTGEIVTGQDTQTFSNPFNPWVEAGVGVGGVLLVGGLFGGRSLIRRRRENAESTALGNSRTEQVARIGISDTDLAQKALRMRENPLTEEKARKYRVKNPGETPINEFATTRWDDFVNLYKKLFPRTTDVEINKIKTDYFDKLPARTAPLAADEVQAYGIRNIREPINVKKPWSRRRSHFVYFREVRRANP